MADWMITAGQWQVEHRIKRSQIDAAVRLRSDRLTGWAASSAALYTMGSEIPSDNLSQVLGKVAAVDSLYNAQVGRVLAAAQWILKLETSGELRDTTASPIDLVERIAGLDGRSAEGCQVFASKYAHFCVDPQRFAIFDKYAARALLAHWGRDETLLEGADRYRKFCHILDRVLSESGLNDCAYGEVDPYLWLSGVYREWVRATRGRRSPQILTECRVLFENHFHEQDDIRALLSQMAPHEWFFETITSRRPLSRRE